MCSDPECSASHVKLSPEKRLTVKMTIEDELILSYYKKIGTLNEAHKVDLVQHRESGAVFVKKELAVFDRRIYERLKARPVRGIPRIADIASDGELLIVIEEYVSGKTLSEIMSNGPLPEKEAVSYMLSLCRILARLHSFEPPIVHRDIKPSNVIIRDDGELILTDLNAAKLSDGRSEKDTVLIGTAGYAAPEQYGFGESVPQTDIYAAGVLFSEMLYGGFSRQRLGNSSADRIIEKCTRMDPQERYKDASQLAEDLELLLQGYAEKNSTAGWRPPGFRSGKISNMIPAACAYIIVIAMSFLLEVKGASQGRLILNRVWLALSFLMVILVMGNYRNIWNRFRITSIKNIWLRYLAAAAASAVLFFLGVVLLVIVEQIFFAAG